MIIKDELYAKWFEDRCVEFLRNFVGAYPEGNVSQNPASMGIRPIVVGSSHCWILLSSEAIRRCLSVTKVKLTVGGAAVDNGR